jgi:hypothetical protein
MFGLAGDVAPIVPASPETTASPQVPKSCLGAIDAAFARTTKELAGGLLLGNCGGLKKWQLRQIVAECCLIAIIRTTYSQVRLDLKSECAGYAALPQN